MRPGTIEQARVSGGGAKSPLWRQIFADVLCLGIVTVNTTEGSTYGAALLAGSGNGIWSDIEAACAQTIRTTRWISPDAQRVNVYQQLYSSYRALYPALRSTFDDLAHIG